MASARPASDGNKFGLLVRSPVPTSLVARMNLVHVADAIPSSSPFPCATGSLVRYSNPIWRLIEQASEHEDLFDDVISNHIFPNDVAGIARRALGSSSDLHPLVYYRTIPSQAREVQRFFAPKLFHLHSFLTMLGGLLSGWPERLLMSLHVSPTRLPVPFRFLPHLPLLASIHFLSPFLPNVQREPLFCPSAGLLFISQAAVAALQ